MSDSFNFWRYEGNVQKKYTDPSRGLYVRRKGCGSCLEKRIGGQYYGD